MLSKDLPDLILAELRAKLEALNLVALLAFAASGLLTAPSLLLLRKLEIPSGIVGGIRSQGASAPVAELIVPWLVILVVCWIISGFIEKQLLPWVLRDLLDDNVWKPQHFEKLSDAEAALLAPIIKTANRLRLSKAALGDGNTSWRFEFRAWIKYPVMVFSAGAVGMSLEWLMREGVRT